MSKRIFSIDKARNFIKDRTARIIGKVSRNLKSYKPEINQERQLSEFIETGFHGDKYLLGLVDFLIKKCSVFVETGTNVGSTLAFIARTYPQISCYSCEPDNAAYSMADAQIRNYENASLFHGTSMNFIQHLIKNESQIFSETSLFWLDAHGYGFEWPLKDEIEFITRYFKTAYILIDDFKVPGRDEFSYDEYDGQTCSFDYIKDNIYKDRNFQLYYPAYSERTSEHHPLRGWGLVVVGVDQLELSERLLQTVNRAKG